MEISHAGKVRGSVIQAKRTACTISPRDKEVGMLKAKKVACGRDIVNEIK
jgi:hypothetical protein